MFRGMTLVSKKDYAFDVPDGDSCMEPDLPEETRTSTYCNNQTPTQNKMASLTGNTVFHKPQIDRNKTKGADVKTLCSEAGSSECLQNNCPDHTPNKLSKRELKFSASTGITGASDFSEVSSSQFMYSSSSGSHDTVQSLYPMPSCASSQLPSCIPSASTNNANKSIILNRDKDTLEFALRCNERSFKVSREKCARTARAESWCSDMDQAQDLGYSSSSTEGCNNNDRVDMDLGSQTMSYAQGTEGCSGDPGVYCSDLEDLLSQFENFFKNRFEAELDNFRTALVSVVEEQKSHVRQIVHGAIQVQSSQSQTSDDLFVEVAAESEEHQNCQTVTANHTVEPGESSSQIETFNYASLCSLPDTNSLGSATEEKQSDKRKDELFELVRLSCSVSTLLAKHQFRA